MSEDIPLLFLQADALELDFGAAILEDLTGETLTRKGQSVRLFDDTANSAEVYYPGGNNGKPAIHNHGTGEHWFPIDAFMEVHDLTWKQAVATLADQYLADGITPNIARRVIQQREKKEDKPTSFHDVAMVGRSLNPVHYSRNYFAHYLRRLFGQPVADELLQRFNVGTSTWHQGATVFWQQDTEGNYRAGKVIAYAHNGRRRKEDQYAPRWAHELQRLPDFNQVQCLFGEHQLRTRPHAPVGIVESEKTAIILSALMPSTVWLATGGSQNIGFIERCSALRSRIITLWPDLDVKFEWYERWGKKAEQLYRLGFDVVVSQYLRENCRVDNRQNKMDVADFLTDPKNRCPETGRLLTEGEYPALWDVADLPGTLPKITVIPFTHEQPAVIVRDEQPVASNLPTETVAEPAISQPLPSDEPSVVGRLVEKNPALADLISSLDLVLVEDTKPQRYIYQTDNEAHEAADEWNVAALESYFATAILPPTFPPAPGQTVTNVGAFVESHLSVTRRNNGKPAYQPYFNRLERLKTALNQTTIA